MVGLIYLAKNKITNKVYIGQTTLSLEKRKNRHKTLSLKPNTHFHRSIAKYGYENFKWFVLEELKEGTQQDLNNLEIKYIEEHKSVKNGYNMTYGGFGGKLSKEVCKKIGDMNRGKPSKYKGIPRTKEVKLKIKLSSLGKNTGSLSEEHKEKIGNANKGHSVSISTKNKISLANKGRNLGPLSLDHKKKISKKLKGKKKPKRTKEHCINISKAKKGKPWSKARRLAQNQKK